MFHVGVEAHECGGQELLADGMGHDPHIDLLGLLLDRRVHHKQNLDQLADQVGVGEVLGLAEHGQQPRHHRVVQRVGDNARHTLHAKQEKVCHVVDDPLGKELEEGGRLLGQGEGRVARVDRVKQP